MNLPVADYSIIYNKKDITADFSAKLISLDYTDKVAGESDELEITLEDAEGLFLNSWYPDKSDTLQCFIRINGKQLDCGIFNIDEPESKGSVAGYEFTIKALAAGFNKKLRTKTSYAHSDKSLFQIANTVAANMGLTVTGKVDNILIHRAHQFRETDLQFLNRLGSTYGYAFSVRGKQLVFVKFTDIESKGAVLTLGRSDLISWDIKDSTNKTFKSSRVRHHDPLNKELIEDTETTDDAGEDGFDGVSDDDLEIHDRVENVQQAKVKALHKLTDSNTRGVIGDFSFPGNLLALSGNNITLTEMGKLNGTYHIFEAKHKVTRDGSYESSVNSKRVKKAP